LLCFSIPIAAVIIFYPHVALTHVRLNSLLCEPDTAPEKGCLFSGPTFTPFLIEIRPTFAEEGTDFAHFNG